MWLLIDDIRDLNCDATARTSEEGKRLLEQGGWEHLCLDNDLGIGQEEGYQILRWALERKLVPRHVQLVTSNTVALSNMQFMLENEGWETVDGRNFYYRGFDDEL